MAESTLEQNPGQENISQATGAAFISVLKRLSEEMNARADDESCKGFSIVAGSMDGEPGFCVIMTREFLLGRIRGAEYDWQAYALIIDKAWAEPNLALIGKRFLDLGIIEEIPPFWNWESIRGDLPKKGTKVNAFFPDKRVLEG
jgi:hypothetical protein